jgi:hypothetical protein
MNSPNPFYPPGGYKKLLATPILPMQGNAPVALSQDEQEDLDELLEYERSISESEEF